MAKVKPFKMKSSYIIATQSSEIFQSDMLAIIDSWRYCLLYLLPNSGTERTLALALSLRHLPSIRISLQRHLALLCRSRPLPGAAGQGPSPGARGPGWRRGAFAGTWKTNRAATGGAVLLHVRHPTLRVPAPFVFQCVCCFCSWVKFYLIWFQPWYTVFFVFFFFFTNVSILPHTLLNLTPANP